MRARELEILRFLIRHPHWHYPQCITEAGHGPRWLVQRTLSRLERHGLIERREDEHPRDEDRPAPWLFRATVVRRIAE